MKKTLSILLTIVIFSCNSTKKVERALLTGDYSRAINLALSQIQKGRDNNKTEEQKVILQKAFEKYQNTQLERVEFLNESPSDHPEEIYHIYNNLYATQRDIEPVLPLFHNNKKLKFKFEDITTPLLQAKRNYAEYLYQSAISHMNNDDVLSYRTAYDIFLKLQRLMPDYKDTNRLLIQSKELGTDYVFVQIFNDSEIAIPKRLEDEILNFNTYGLQDEWTVYHANKSDGNPYNFNIDLRFQTIIFSPERIVEKEVPVSRQIEITENQKDREGNILRDSDGNPLTYLREVTVEGILNTITQEKLVSLIAQVDYYNNSNGQKMNDYKLDSQFLFVNNFATFKGDKRALTEEQLLLLGGQAVPFPSNEQMLFDAAEDVKNKFKSILNRHHLN
jgi:hypothetical protein